MIRKILFWNILDGNNVLLFLFLRQLPLESLDGILFLQKVFLEGVNDGSVPLAHLLHLLILVRDHQLALLELDFEGVNDGSVLLGHLLNDGVEGVNDRVLLFNPLVSPLSKGVS